MVSVIIPVYNGEQFLDRAIHSVLSQKETGELIIVNDGSTDRSLTICKKWSKSYPKIKIINHPDNVNKGIAVSSNLGIKIARMPYLTFLDQDDYYLQDRFKKSIQILQNNPDVDGVYGKIENFNDSINYSKQIYNPILANHIKVKPEDLFLYLIQDFNPHFAHCSVVYRTKGARNIFFDPNIKYGTDLDFLYQAALALTMIDECDVPKIKRRLHDKNFSYSKEFNDYNPRLKMAEKWFQKIKNGNFSKRVNRALFYRLVTRMYFSNHKNEFALKRYPIKIGYFVNLIIKNPWILKYV